MERPLGRAERLGPSSRLPGVPRAGPEDFRGKLPGRGAYVCPDPACLAKARKSKALERAFSAPLPPEVWEALEEQMKEVPTDAQ